MVFRDRNELGGAVGLAGGGVNHPFQAKIAGGLHHVQGAMDVGVDIAGGRHIAVGNRDQSSQVEHRAAAPHRLPHAERVPDVTQYQLKVCPGIGRKRVEPAVAPDRVVLAERPHGSPFGQQGFHQMGTDEPIGSGDQGPWGHGDQRVQPSSTIRFCPLIALAPSESRNTMVAATSAPSSMPMLVQSTR